MAAGLRAEAGLGVVLRSDAVRCRGAHGFPPGAYCSHGRGRCKREWGMLDARRSGVSSVECRVSRGGDMGGRSLPHARCWLPALHRGSWVSPPPGAGGVDHGLTEPHRRGGEGGASPLAADSERRTPQGDAGTGATPSRSAASGGSESVVGGGPGRPRRVRDSHLSPAARAPTTPTRHARCWPHRPGESSRCGDGAWTQGTQPRHTLPKQELESEAAPAIHSHLIGGK